MLCFQNDTLAALDAAPSASFQEDAQVEVKKFVEWWETEAKVDCLRHK